MHLPLLVTLSTASWEHKERGKKEWRKDKDKQERKKTWQKISHLAGCKINPDDLSVCMFRTWKSEGKHIKQR